ncbi:MAG: DUF5716 family protein, partial [Lachnospiraceae bacterium]|nr:DUF5716 family protein [Lachnospiraceae bacterium]
MSGLVLGVDLCNEYTQVYSFAHDRGWGFPTVVLKKRAGSEWLSGEAAYEAALAGAGTPVDRLVEMAIKNGTATIDQVKYSGVYLLQMFLRGALHSILKETGEKSVSRLVVALPKLDPALMDNLLLICGELGVGREDLHVISHCESFLYFVLSQKREIWNNQTGMFDLSDGRLRYYEMKMRRGLRQMTILGEYEELEEKFNLDLIDTPSGSRLADRIMCNCGKRMLGKKLFSAVFLTGKGFNSLDWAPEWTKVVCDRRKVFQEPYLFAKGAAYNAADYDREKTAYPYILLCDGRLDTSVTLKVTFARKEKQLVLSAAGERWYEAKTTVDLILDGQSDLDFSLTTEDGKKKRWQKIPLDGLPKRPDRATRITLT